jgi:hypothetical protein
MRMLQLLAALTLATAATASAQIRDPFVATSPQPTLRPSYLDIVTTSDNVHFSITGTFLYGPVDGYAQTPAGGQPGSSSSKRPRFSELGIHDATIGAGELSAFFGHHEIFVAPEIIRLSGSDTLRSDLITHGQTFPAGTHVSSDLTLDTYRIGYRYHFLIGADTPRPRLDLAPYLDLDLWNFDYHIAGGGHSTSRGYLKPTVQLGISAEWSPGGGPFSLTGDFAASPPGISSIPFIAYEQLAARYRFTPSPRLNIVTTLGVRFEQYNYFDNQSVSNHIHATFGPMLVAGLGLEF